LILPIKPKICKTEFLKTSAWVIWRYYNLGSTTSAWVIWRYYNLGSTTSAYTCQSRITNNCNKCPEKRVTLTLFNIKCCFVSYQQIIT
jgi:hypothetical protein